MNKTDNKAIESKHDLMLESNLKHMDAGRQETIVEIKLTLDRIAATDCSHKTLVEYCAHLERLRQMEYALDREINDFGQPDKIWKAEDSERM